ncbi:MAG: Uma2 family endonuclease [Actinomycetota bacterium]
MKGAGDRVESMESSRTLTYDDLLAFPDDGLRRELIDGELVVSPSPKTRHQSISVRLTLALGNHINAHGGATLFHAPLDVLFSNRDVVEPDLLVVLDDQREIMTEKNIQGVPVLLIEIVSDARLDKVRKRDLYARFGVPEYWVVDPDEDRVEVYRHDGAGYGKPAILVAGDEVTFQPLPGLRILVADLLAE